MIEWIGMGFVGLATVSGSFRTEIGKPSAGKPGENHHGPGPKKSSPWPVAIRVRGPAQPFLCGAAGHRQVGGMELLLGPFPTRISANDAALDTAFLVDATAAALWPGEQGTTPCPLDRKFTSSQRIAIDEFAATSRVEDEDEAWYVHVRVRAGVASMHCSSCSLVPV